MKILYIETCEDCPHGMPDATSQCSDDYWWGEYSKGNRCGCYKMQKALPYSEFSSGIPEWCPLEDKN